MQENTQAQTEQQLALVRHVQYAEMLNMHYQNHYKMLHSYTGSRPIDTMLNSSELEPDYYDVEGIPVWKIGDCELTVVPSDMADHPYRWAVVDGPMVVFRAPLNKTIVYLSLPLSSFSRSAELTLQDEVYWIEGYKVMAAGVIEHALLRNAIVTEDALIVPVVVRPFVHRFVPFNMRDAGYGENIEAYQAFESEHATTCDGFQMALPGVPREQMPPVAIKLEPVIGFDLLNYIDDDYNFGLSQTSTTSL